MSKATKKRSRVQSQKGILVEVYDAPYDEGYVVEAHVGGKVYESLEPTKKQALAQAKKCHRVHALGLSLTEAAFMLEAKPFTKAERKKARKVKRVVKSKKTVVRKPGRKVGRKPSRKPSRKLVHKPGRKPGRKVAKKGIRSGWKKGSMHRVTGTPKGRRISTKKLIHEFKHGRGKAKGRARFLLNLRGVKTSQI